MEGNYPNNNPVPPAPMAPAKSSFWLWTVVGVAVLAGLIYFWSNRSDMVQNPAPENLNTSDEVVDIEADLNATDVDNVDYDLNEENYNAS